MIEEKKFKYLVRDKDNSKDYLINDGGVGCYCSDPTKGIFDVLPKSIPEKGNYDYEVIRSDNPEFIEILKTVLNDGIHISLERQIEHAETNLKDLKRSRKVILETLEFLDRN